MTTVLGLDPGGTTGAALIEWDGAHPIGRDGNVRVVGSWQVPYEEMPAWANLVLPRADHVAVERYFITPRTLTGTRQYEALYVIGGVTFLLSLLDEHLRPDLWLGSASNSKRAWSNDHLREAGLYDAVEGRHARDALRMALLRCLSLG